MTDARRSVTLPPASRRIIRGRHLRHIECLYCGPVEHAPACLQVGEVLICWDCVCLIVTRDPLDSGDLEACELLHYEPRYAELAGDFLLTSRKSED